MKNTQLTKTIKLVGVPAMPDLTNEVFDVSTKFAQKKEQAIERAMTAIFGRHEACSEAEIEACSIKFDMDTKSETFLISDIPMIEFGPIYTMTEINRGRTICKFHQSIKELY